MNNHIPANDYIYYDLQIYNFNNNKTDTLQPLTFNESRASYFVNKASDYKMSIVRFELDCFNTLPIYEAEIVPNQSNPNLTTSTITLEYDDGAGNIYTTNPNSIIWVPENKTISVPNPPTTTPAGFQVQSPYYYSFSFHYVINLINTTFNTAWEELKLLVISGALKYVEAPFLEWNAPLNTASLYVRQSLFNLNAYPQVRIYFNRPLYALLNSFPAIQYSINSPNNKIFQLALYSNLANTIYFPQNNNPFMKIDQEYSTIQQWTPVSSIVFTSGTIPVAQNQLSSPIQFVNGQIVQLASSNSYSQPIITDFIADDLYPPTLLYVPAVYRYVSLASDQPLNSIDISVMYRDKAGNLNPVFLPVGGSCSVKIMFEKIK